MSEENNLSLWRGVEKTPDTATKNAKVGGQNITSIDTIHMVKLATRKFGPAGIGWGYRVDVDRFDQGAPVMLGQNVVGHEMTHTLQLTLWYEWEGKRGEVTHFGHTRAVYMTNNGKFITDGEAPKKSLTDAMKKCLSQLGFAADIFSGLFDNPDYVAQRKAETRLEQAEDFDAELDKLRERYKKWLGDECETMRSKIPHPKSISLAADNVLNRLNDKASIARVDQEAVDKARQLIIKARDEGIARLYAEQEAKKQEAQS